MTVSRRAPGTGISVTGALFFRIQIRLRAAEIRGRVQNTALISDWILNENVFAAASSGCSLTVPDSVQEQI